MPLKIPAGFGVGEISRLFKGWPASYYVILAVALAPVFYLLVLSQYSKGQSEPAYVALFIVCAFMMVRGLAAISEMPDLDAYLEGMRAAGFALPLLMCGYTAYWLIPSLSCPYLMTYDSIFHYVPASHLVVEDIGRISLFGRIDFQGGMPLLLHYSPMLFWTFGALHAATFGLVRVNELWTIYQALIVLGISLTSYYFMRTLGFTRLEAFFAGLFVNTWRQDSLSDFSPYTMYTSWGLIPQVFSYITVILFLACFYRLMIEQSRRNVISAGIVFLAAFLSHGYFSILAMLTVTGYFAASVLLHGGLRGKLKAIACMFLVAAAASMFYTIPYAANHNYVIDSWNLFGQKPVADQLKDFVENKGDMALDGKFPYLRLLGALGVISLLRRRNRDGKVMLLAFALAPLVFLLGDVSLPLTQPIAYTHANARGMAEFKVAWILLAVVGAYELCDTIKKIVKRPYLAAAVLLMLVATDQNWINSRVNGRFICFDYLDAQGFGMPQGDVQDIRAMSQILAQRAQGRFMISKVDFSLLLYPFTGDGVYVDWPTDKRNMRLRYGAFYLYGKLKEHDFGRALLAMEKMGIRYVVYRANDKSENGRLYQNLSSAGNMSVLYERRMGLMELDGVLAYEVPGGVVAVLDDIAFWENTTRWMELMDSGGLSRNTTYVLLRSGEFDEEALDAFDTFVIGEVRCDGVKKLKELVEAAVRKGKTLYALNNTVVCGVGLDGEYGIQGLKGDLDAASRSAAPIHGGSVEELFRDDYGRDFVVSSASPGAVPLVIKDNYYPHWVITQGKPLRKYFSLPSNMLVFVRPDETVKARYTTPAIEWLGMALSALVLIALARAYIAG